MRTYVINVLVGFDTFVNSILGGSPYETISLRAALASRQGKRWGCVLCKVLNVFQKDHCTLAREHAIAFASWLTAQYKAA